MLSTISNSSGKTFGTKEERLAMRRRVYAYYQTFGRPHLMITASPRDDNSFWIAVHAGFDASTPATVAQSFEDLWNNFKPFPHQDDLRRAALKDPTLAAIHFDDFSTFFFEKIIGWNKTSGKSVDGGGLFGKAVAYTAGVETQGGGTLHFHALITLEDFPATAKEEELWTPAFKQEYCDYADSIASAVYPIYHYFMNASNETSEGEEPELHCPVCATGRLEAVDLKFVLKTNQVKFPHPMCKCTACKKSFTAQSLRVECMRFIARLAGIDLKGLGARVANLLSGTQGN